MLNDLHDFDADLDDFFDECERWWREIAIRSECSITFSAEFNPPESATRLRPIPLTLSAMKNMIKQAFRNPEKLKHFTRTRQQRRLDLLRAHQWSSDDMPRPHLIPDNYSPSAANISYDNSRHNSRGEGHYASDGVCHQLDDNRAATPFTPPCRPTIDSHIQQRSN